jgi:hypothetical protein
MLIDLCGECLTDKTRETGRGRQGCTFIVFLENPAGVSQAVIDKCDRSASPPCVSPRVSDCSGALSPPHPVQTPTTNTQDREDTYFLAALIFALWNLLRSNSSTFNLKNSSHAPLAFFPLSVRRSPSPLRTTSLANAFNRTSACSTLRSPLSRSALDSKICASIQSVKISRQAYKSFFEFFDDACETLDCGTLEGVRGVCMMVVVVAVEGWMVLEIRVQRSRTDWRKRACWASWNVEREVRAAVKRLKNARSDARGMMNSLWSVSDPAVSDLGPEEMAGRLSISASLEVPRAVIVAEDADDVNFSSYRVEGDVMAASPRERSFIPSWISWLASAQMGD